VRNDPVLLLNNLSASFLSLLQESLSRREEGERANCSSAAFLQFHIPGRKLLATIAFAAAASSSSRASSLTHSLTQREINLIITLFLPSSTY
jgi:hypothetical protein